MAEDSNDSEFYWDNIFIKVEDKFFCVPRCEFVQSSVFARMFLSPSRPQAASGTHSKGQDREHPIVLEGYKKDEFTCLLKVMYPTAKSLPSYPGTDLNLCMTIEGWASVLKLSTIWNMTKIRQYAILRLSAASLSPIEKILLARAYKVSAWLDEAVTSLVTCNPMPALEDLATIGWETVARIYWIRDDVRNTLRFRRDAIKCSYCPSSPSKLVLGTTYTCHSRCGKAVSEYAEMTCGSGSASSSPIKVTFREIQCKTCKGKPFDTSGSFRVVCYSCKYSLSKDSLVIVTPNNSLKPMIEEMFGEEIKDYEPSLLRLQTSNNSDISRSAGKH